ncbi:MAG: Oxidoreductase alpha (molybdopterin) subunit, partial [Actinomycetia bacterium]|nr:Oxidoreductase alpha (molybdopterin) subunit [Actinomycetes bacterium]
EAGEYRGRVRRVKLPSGTLQVHWPEGNVLLSSGPEHREPESHVPDYTAIVSLERA